eukprot:m.27824 g.27824  ORF g.27824 m.27824 type:complete len:377 (+) comp7940_c0_seq1:124-1254(+)
MDSKLGSIGLTFLVILTIAVVALEYIAVPKSSVSGARGLRTNQVVNLVSNSEGSRPCKTCPACPKASQSTTGNNGGQKPVFGFYIHSFQEKAAILYQLRQLKKFFPDSPVHITSDGGISYAGLCKEYGCTTVTCPPANDRWHPWPFLARMRAAAEALDSEYMIMLEPDNTIHREIRIMPDKDAGGIADMNPHYGIPMQEAILKIAYEQNNVPRDFKWEYTGSGLAGGMYIKIKAVLEAFSDKAVAELPWAKLEKFDSKRIYSSDFAMPLLLTAKGFTYGPWKEIKQVENKDRTEYNNMQPKEAAFQHYSRSVEGGKPTHQMKLEGWEEEILFGEQLKVFKEHSSNCQKCWNREEYLKLWGDIGSCVPSVDSPLITM